MRDFKVYLGGLILLLLAGAFAFQAKSLRELHSRTAALQTQLATFTGEPIPAPPAAAVRRPEPDALVTRIDYRERLQELENAVAQLTRATDYLMERGQLPMATNKLEDLQRRLADASVAERDRLQALRLLRRNRGLSDEALQHTINWVQTTQDADIRREVLQQLDGVTNAAMREPLMTLAANDPDSEVREEAVENLRHFLSDPQVENRLWEMMQKDPDPEVREQAEKALSEGPVTPERLVRLRQRASDPQATLDDKLTALRALRRAGADATEAIADIAQVVQSTTDPATRARVFDAWDGSRDPAIKVPLVHGLQDANPIVRQRAADALSSFVNDPRVQEWLNYMAASDPDPMVRREASQALMERPRR